jgi:hypothetical protein
MKAGVLIIMSFFLLISCEQKARLSRQQAAIRQDERIIIDTAAYAVLPYKAAFINGIFPQAQATTPSVRELIEIDSLLKCCVADFNLSQRQKFKSEDRLRAHTIYLPDYRRQIISVIVPSGERIAWVNCFCENRDDWRKQVILVDDGGNCFFNLKINLTTSMCYDFAMNERG